MLVFSGIPQNVVMKFQVIKLSYAIETITLL